MRTKNLVTGFIVVLIIGAACWPTLAQDLPDVSISGSGKIEAGEYNQITVSGSGEITGEVKAKKIHVSGSSDFNGAVSADHFTGSGSTKVFGNMNARKFNSSGSTKITGDLVTANGETSGSLTVKGLLKPEFFESSGSLNAGGIDGVEVKSTGSIDVDRDVALKKFTSRGSFAVGGVLAADDLDVLLGGRSHATELTGKTIDVRYKRSLWLKARRRLRADTITGDEGRLERTDAKLVKGDVVVIGPGCVIEKVEYAKSIEVDKSAIVGQQAKK